MAIINKNERLKALSKQKELYETYCLKCKHKRKPSIKKHCRKCSVWKEFQDIGKALDRTLSEREEVG